jgi:SAM-dependent methyltransferase
VSGKAEAWSQYWREAAGTGSGCASGAAGITAACARLWREFAATLPRSASVLDLATGNGAVLGHIGGVRPDLRLTGVDSALDLGRGREGTPRLMAGVAMEQLPFDAASFDAVTSQFGFEYGDTDAIAAEVARVLRPGGVLRLLIHHAGSPVVAQGIARAEQLRWALAPGSPLEQAVKFAAARQLAPLPLPPALRGAPGEAARRFSGPSAAAEIMTGMVQVLELGGPQAPDLLRKLRNNVAGELARLEALVEAARDQTAIETIRGVLEGAGLPVGASQPVREGANGPVFAWQIDAKAP